MAENTKEDAWALEPAVPTTIEGDELERWYRLRAAVASTAKRFRWSKSEVSKRSAVPNSTFWQWWDGTYKGVLRNVSDKLEKWLDSVVGLTEAAARVPVEPPYFDTPSAIELTDALTYAQAMPELILAVYGAGMGKTRTAKQYVANNPHAFMVTMRPRTSKVNSMLLEIAQVLDVPPAERQYARLDRAIGSKLKRNGRQTLLIVDEAQNLIDKAVDQLRYFLDEFGVGIALVGNEELYGRFGGKEPTPAYAQLHRRFGLRLRRLQPQPGDIDAQIEAWGIADPDIRKLAHAIGRKPGALGQVTKTLQLAGMYAAGEQREMTIADVRAALRNRGLEE